MNNASINLLLVSILVVLIGCATPYQPSKGNDYGYSDTLIKEGVYRVSFRGDENDSIKNVEEMLLLRCAEVTLENGYKYFEIDDTSKYMKSTGSIAAGNNLKQGILYNDNFVIQPEFKHQTMPFPISIPIRFRQTRIICYKLKDSSKTKLHDASEIKNELWSKHNKNK